MELRPYQQAALAACQEHWRDFRRLLLVLPTGTGKTIIFANLAANEAAAGRQTLILAHRDELIQQAADKLNRACGLGCAVEQAGQHAADSLYPITVGSVQTLTREKRLAAFAPDYYDLLVVDEAHHALSDSYRRILDHFASARVVGVTATPDRGDRKTLGAVFEQLAYEYPLPRAIADGYLCPIRAQTLPLNIDLAKVRVTAGDFNDADLGDALAPYLEQIADHVARVARERKVLAFLPLRATSRTLAGLLAARGLLAAHVDGDSTDRRELLADFAGNKLRCLCNSMLLTEGYDQPDIDCIVPLRPTKVRSLYAQMVGRGTRLAPGKEALLILDFLFHTERHELCRPACLTAPRAEIAAKVQAAQDAAGSAGESVDLLAAEADAESTAKAEREGALAKALREQHGKRGRLLDPVEFALSIADEDLADYEPCFAWESHPPTDRQLETLEKWGFSADTIQNKGMASRLLSRIFARREAGLATPKQVRLLAREGVAGAAGLTFEAANQTITTLAAQRGWGRR